MELQELENLIRLMKYLESMRDARKIKKCRKQIFLEPHSIQIVIIPPLSEHISRQ